MLSFLNAMLGDHTRGPVARDDRLLRAIMDAAPVAMAVMDSTQPGPAVLYINPEFSQVTGYLPGDIVGRDLSLLCGEETLPAAWAMIVQAMTLHQPAAAELTAYRKDGVPIELQIRVAPAVDECSQAVRYVLAFHDVTESRRNAASLLQRERRLSAVVGALPLPMLIAGSDGRIREANALARASLRADDLQGRDLAEFLDFQGLVGRIPRDGAVSEVEMRLRPADGSSLCVLGSAVRFDMDGEEATIFVFVDISGQKLRERELARAKDDAERATRAKVRFFAAASHDLRQPLQALALFTTALEMHISTPAAQTILSSIKLSLSTMEEMFDSLLDMSRLDAGVLTPEPEIFMVNDLLERLEVEFAPQVSGKGLQLRVVPSSAAVRSDPALLGRILRNFLSNAVRYTPTGRILLGCKRHGPNLRILVADTGPGIPEDQRLAIFEEFFQGGDRASSAGLGLGLAIVQRLARLLSHPLDVRSKLGAGTCFSVDVPMAEPPVQFGGEDEGEEEPEDLAGKVVLVVDDDEAVRRGLTMLIEDWGGQAIALPSAEDALEALRTQGLRPDVILADYRAHVGEGEGTPTVERLLQELGLDVPTFLFTGGTEMGDGWTARGGRRFEVLQKPLNPVKLRAVLSEALRQQDSGRPG